MSLSRGRVGFDLPHQKWTHSLKAHLGWGKPRVECFVGMLLGLLRLKQITRRNWRWVFASDAEVKSRYRRLQRFFAGVWFDYDAIARLQMSLFDFPRQKYYLTLDRTNWQWGKTDINVLTLGVYKGSAIPVYWLVGISKNPPLPKVIECLNAHF